MTLNEAVEALRAIREAARDGDYESAHGLEDKLHRDVLATIASGNAMSPVHLAAAALLSGDIQFERHCA